MVEAGRGNLREEIQSLLRLEPRQRLLGTGVVLERLLLELDSLEQRVRFEVDGIPIERLLAGARRSFPVRLNAELHRRKRAASAQMLPQLDRALRRRLRWKPPRGPNKIPSDSDQDHRCTGNRHPRPARPRQSPAQLRSDDPHLVWTSRSHAGRSILAEDRPIDSDPALLQVLVESRP